MGAFGQRATAVATATRPRFSDAMRWVSDRLVAAGLRTVVDLREVSPTPCVWIELPTIRFRFGSTGAFDIDHAVCCIVGNSGSRWTDYDALSELVSATQAALDDLATSARRAEIWSTDQTQVMPAMELTWTATVRG